MSITLPTSPAPRSATPRQLDFGRNLTPSLGGPAQRLNRLGNRFAIDVQLPPMRETDARVWINRLNRGKAEGVILNFPQPGLSIGSPGIPQAQWGDQTGSSLGLNSFAGGYVVREGQFFSITVGGRRYLHHATAATTANGSGQMTLPIYPMLRVVVPAAAPLAFAPPVIEGFLADGDMPWTLETASIYGLSFSISEAE